MQRTYLGSPQHTSQIAQFGVDEHRAVVVSPRVYELERRARDVLSSTAR